MANLLMDPSGTIQYVVMNRSNNGIEVLRNHCSMGNDPWLMMVDNGQLLKIIGISMTTSQYNCCP